MLADDVCDCGLCGCDTCDFCPRSSARLDDEGTSFCVACWRRLVDEAEPPAWWLDRQMGLEPMSASEEARYYQRMKGEHLGW